MIFSSENIENIRDRIGIFDEMDDFSYSPSKASTTYTTNDLDFENSMESNNWYFGIPLKTYPYYLLRTILTCLNQMGFVIFHCIYRNGNLMHQDTK